MDAQKKPIVPPTRPLAVLPAALIPLGLYAFGIISAATLWWVLGALAAIAVVLLLAWFFTR
ncbi:Uncharacterised protein [Corynebacterium renale]|uniref:hypothetical protein n=1 Tax=Corynebacterium renale TaxID=1724 RepID=UPI000DA3C3CE|nr:hypothetical protein [Corynebacterium renale]SQG63326.1 Uncharacterised protein [Corynebacterium renale]STC99551.1 Uncharacterised protein [Corynebacterium renale]